MKLYRYLKYRRWTLWEFFCSAMTYGVGRRLGVSGYFRVRYEHSARRAMDRRFLRHSADGDYYDIRGIRMPVELKQSLFEDVLMEWAWFDDRCDVVTTSIIDSISTEGAYSYDDGEVQVTVEAGDTVIDAGAEMGDFSAYCAHKGAIAYAFEPVAANFPKLERTVQLNAHKTGKIVAIRMGLGESEGEMKIDGSGSIVSGSGAETIVLTTVDAFVKANGLKRVDFIKADIEGAERDMLRGARETLRTMAPKLSICTYHLPDDPEVLAATIMEANPNYRIVQRRKKLVASVPK